MTAKPLKAMSTAYSFRDPQPGDMGWVVHRHGALYAQEHGWNTDYEALVADIISKYMLNHDKTCERTWIVEKDGVVIGSAFVVRQDEVTAKLRLFYLEPHVRGLGIGRRLMDECLQFAKKSGYNKMELWTVSTLNDARRLYEKSGFKKTGEERLHSFGKDLTGEMWTRDL